MLFKSSLYIAESLPRQNQVQSKDEEIRGMKLSIDVITDTSHISTCMLIHNTQDVT